MCPIHQWAAITQWVLSYPGTTSISSVNTILNDKGKLASLDNKMILDKLQAASTAIRSHELGFTADKIGLHSLQSGTAMAIYLSGIPVYTMMLIMAGGQVMLSWDTFRNKCKSSALELARKCKQQMSSLQSWRHSMRTLECPGTISQPCGKKQQWPWCPTWCCLALSHFVGLAHSLSPYPYVQAPSLWLFGLPDCYFNMLQVSAFGVLEMEVIWKWFRDLLFKPNPVSCLHM